MKDDPLNRQKVLRGEQLPHSKLTDSKVRQIRRLIALRRDLLAEAAELTNAKLAEQYGVHFRTIDRISTGETWGHVDD